MKDPFAKGQILEAHRQLREFRQRADRLLVDTAVNLNATCGDGRKLLTVAGAWEAEEIAVAEAFATLGEEIAKLLTRLQKAPSADLPKLLAAVKQCYSGV